jgi:hypothetical protein
MGYAMKENKTNIRLRDTKGIISLWLRPEMKLNLHGIK